MPRISAAMQASLDRMGAPSQKINSGVRTKAEQALLYARYLSDVRLGRKPPRYAAKPGTSNHEDPPATAMDVDTSSPLHAHLLKHGAAHGWHRPLLHLGEPWHWEYDASKDQHLPRASREAVDKLTGAAMRAVATTSGRRFVLGELTYQDMSKHWDHASHEAKIWNSDTGSEPQIIPDATLDLAIGQIQQRRAQLAAALKALGV